MDLEKLEKMAILLKDKLESRGGLIITEIGNPVLYAEIKNLINLSSSVLPEHKTFLTTFWSRWNYGIGKPRSEALSMGGIYVKLGYLCKAHIDVFSTN